MALFEVDVQVTGYVRVQVNAHSREQARAIVFSQLPDGPPALVEWIYDDEHIYVGELDE